jgi:hypothetical protein
MSTLTDRMQHIQDNRGGTYYGRLIENFDGLENAAIVDLAIDGNYTYLDLRRAPFAGNDELKAIARRAVDAQRDLSDRLIGLAWAKPTDIENGSQS